MMDGIQIFNNPEFGDVRTMMIDNEPWFVAKDISDKLGYAQTSNMMKRIDEEDSKSSILDGMNMKSLLINESGLYSAILGSKLESAKRFKRWVTSEVLPSIRKRGGYQMPITTNDKIALLAQGHMELKQEIDEVKSDLETLKMDLPVLPVEADRITNAVKQKGVTVMGGKDSNAYRDRSLRHKLYSSIYANLKYNFGVRTYKALKRSQTEKALEIISAYQPPFILAEQIDNVNAQQTLIL